MDVAALSLRHFWQRANDFADRSSLLEASKFKVPTQRSTLSTSAASDEDDDDDAINFSPTAMAPSDRASLEHARGRKPVEFRARTVRVLALRGPCAGTS